MKWAIAQGHRQDNPAGDAVTAALPKQSGARKHLRALPHRDVGDAVVRIRRSKAHAPLRLAVEFAIVTSVRSGEVRGAVWEEFDLDTGLWTIPGERMKAGRQHRVPLSRQAVDVLAEARGYSGGSGLVFPSKSGGEIPSWALAKLISSLGIGGTLHGMRSSFPGLVRRNRCCPRGSRSVPRASGRFRGRAGLREKRPPPTAPAN